MTCGLKLVSESSHQSQLWRRRWACHGQQWRCHPGWPSRGAASSSTQTDYWSSIPSLSHHIPSWSHRNLKSPLETANSNFARPDSPEALPMSRFLKSELLLLQSNKLPVNELSTVTVPYLIPKLFQAVWKFWKSITWNKKEKKMDASLSNVLRKKTESQMPLLAQNLKRL